MTHFSEFWARRRTRVIAATVGVGLAGAVAVGGVAAASAATTDSAGVNAVPAAAASPSPSAKNTDVARLRSALHDIRSMPSDQRAAAVAKLKADVLAGKYGTTLQHDLKAIDDIVGAHRGMGNALLRLAVVHDHGKHAGSGSTATPMPKPTASS